MLHGWPKPSLAVSPVLPAVAVRSPCPEGTGVTHSTWHAGLRPPASPSVLGHRSRALILDPGHCLGVQKEWGGLRKEAGWTCRQPTTNGEKNAPRRRVEPTARRQVNHTSQFAGTDTPLFPAHARPWTPAPGHRSFSVSCDSPSSSNLS